MAERIGRTVWLSDARALYAARRSIPGDLPGAGEPGGPAGALPGPDALVGPVSPISRLSSHRLQPQSAVAVSGSPPPAGVSPRPGEAGSAEIRSAYSEAAPPTIQSEVRVILDAARAPQSVDVQRTLLALRFLRFKLEQRHPPTEAFTTPGIQRAVVNLIRCPSAEVSQEAASCVGGYSYTAKLAWELVQAGFLDVFQEMVMNAYGTTSPGMFDAIMLALGNVIGDQDTRCARAVEGSAIPPIIADLVQAYQGLSSSNLRNTLFVLGNILMRAKAESLLELFLPVIPTVVKLLYTVGDQNIHMDCLWAIYYALYHVNFEIHSKLVSSLCNAGFFPLLLELFCQGECSVQKISLEILKRTLIGQEEYARLGEAGPPKTVSPDVVYAAGGMPSEEIPVGPGIRIGFNEYVLVLIVKAATTGQTTQRTIALSILYHLSGIGEMAPVLERYGAIAAALLGMTVMTERIGYYSAGIILHLAKLPDYVLDITPSLIQVLSSFLDSWEGQRDGSSCLLVGLKLTDELLARGAQSDDSPGSRDTRTLDEIYAEAAVGEARLWTPPPRGGEEVSNPVLMHLVGAGIRSTLERLKVAGSDKVAQCADELDLKYGIMGQRYGHHVAGYDSVDASDDIPGF